MTSHTVKSNMILAKIHQDWEKFLTLGLENWRDRDIRDQLYVFFEEHGQSRHNVTQDSVRRHLSELRALSGRGPLPPPPRREPLAPRTVERIPSAYQMALEEELERYGNGGGNRLLQPSSTRGRSTSTRSRSQGSCSGGSCSVNSPAQNYPTREPGQSVQTRADMDELRQIARQFLGIDIYGRRGGPPFPEMEDDEPPF